MCSPGPVVPIGRTLSDYSRDAEVQGSKPVRIIHVSDTHLRHEALLAGDSNSGHSDEAPPGHRHSGGDSNLGHSHDSRINGRNKTRHGDTDADGHSGVNGEVNGGSRLDGQCDLDLGQCEGHSHGPWCHVVGPVVKSQLTEGDILIHSGDFTRYKEHRKWFTRSNNYEDLLHEVRY